MADITINGETKALDAPGDTPLLWAVRDLAGLTGTKYGCGVGLCGACTVHVDGKPEKSCLLSLDDVQGKQVTTIEGLSADGNHPVQVAWRDQNVPQCGFCQAGQIMQAAGFLQENPKPSDQQIKDAMEGNICRCGCYQRITAAVRQASTGS